MLTHGLCEELILIKNTKHIKCKNTGGNYMSTNKELKPYYHLAKYYETDQMAVVHHSNYIRWFEEARVDFLQQIGLGYDTIEAAGIYSPVLSATCEYKSSVKFNDMVIILPKLEFFNGIKMTIGYRVMDSKTKQIKAVGETKHCFVSKDFKPVSLKRDYKDMFAVLDKWTNI